MIENVDITAVGKELCFNATEVGKLCYFQDAITLGVVLFILGLIVGGVMVYFRFGIER
jgi:hypothetical protein